MKSQWIEAQGQRIFFADDSGFGGDNVALHREVSEAVEAIKRALLGVSGSRRFFITTFANVTGGLPVVAFDIREQALAWLTSM